MSRCTLGRLLLASLLMISVAIGQAAADESSPAKKRAHKGAKKPSADQKESGDSASSTAKATPDQKKPDEKSVGDHKKGVEKKPAAEKESVAKPATQKLKKGPFRIEVALDGIFEAQNQVELFVRPQESVAGLSVLKAVEHGAVVKQGDLVLAFDTERIDRAIADLRSELQLNELALKQAEAQLAAQEKITPLEDQANNRTRRMSEEDWKRFQEVEKPLFVKLTEFRLKAYREMLEYAEEEYRQLEKMYKADDLREETEKIVLRRAKNGVDRAKLDVELAQAAHEEALKFSLPRTEERAKDQTERLRIDTELTRLNLPLSMSKRRLDVEKLQVARNLAEERLKKLISDRDAMIVKAPIDGVVYYGRAVRGKWSAFSVETLRRGAAIMPNEVFMTVVQTRPLIIRTTVPESQLQRVHTGLQAVVQPVGFAGQKLSAVVQRVGTIPMGSSGFDCQLTVASDGLNSAIVPGMNCEMKMIPYKKTDALTVPPKAVFTEEFDPAKQYVYRQGKDGKPQKRVVTLGERNDKQIEVLAGLAEGDDILLEKPKEE
ncbi:MAG: efflux RND transporter periplasmic adaptor subunit [Thermoguttaceae bacterium]